MDDVIRERSEGRARTGFVNVRSFNRGVIETLGAVSSVVDEEEHYFLTLAPVETVGFDPATKSPFNRGSVAPRPGLPGIPVTFSDPESVFKKYSLPAILVRLEGLDPAMQRWHPGLLQYRAPGRGALVTQYQSTPTSAAITGFDRVEQVDQAPPYDLVYSINVVAPKRGGGLGVGFADRMLDHVLRTYPAYCEVKVKDSIGDLRSYESFMDGVSLLDSVDGIADRVVGFSVSLRIEGELDTIDPVVRRTVTKRTTTLRPR